MATATKNIKKTPAELKAIRSEAGKKAAATRKAKKLEAEAQVQADHVKASEEQEAVKVALTEQTDRVKICDVICETLLLIRPGTENNARPEGYTYRECLAIMLERIRPSNPDAETSLNCLRWYATKLRSEGTIVPHRPNSAPTRKPKKSVDPTA